MTSLRVGVVTLFPSLLEAFASTSIVGRAIEAELLALHLEDLRAHGVGRYKSVDDTPYGGGSGMVLRADCVVSALDAAAARLAAPVAPCRVLLTPQGERFTQRIAEELVAQGAFILTCGRYEGFDERVRSFVDREISLGDFVMAGGEVAAMAIVEATARLVPGVLGNLDSARVESFSASNRGLLEFPQFTRPLEFRGLAVPEVLRGGNHAEIDAWRAERALERTRQRRPDLARALDENPAPPGPTRRDPRCNSRDPRLRLAPGFSNYPRTMSTARIGETRLPKNFKRYAKQFSLLELDCEPGNVPGKGRLEACAAAAPPGFTFSLVVPSRVAGLETGPEFDKALKAAANVARVLSAQWWVVRTPAEVRPTRRSRESLGALVARLKEGGMRVAWEPRGVWDEAAAGDAADAIGAVLVQDIAREVPRPGRVLYSRLLALGRGGRVGLSLADVVAERLSRYEEAYVVVEGQGAREIQQALGLALDDAALDDAGLDASASDDDNELDEDDDDGELANGLDVEHDDDGDDASDDFADDLDDADEAR